MQNRISAAVVAAAQTLQPTYATVCRRHLFIIPERMEPSFRRLVIMSFDLLTF